MAWFGDKLSLPVTMGASGADGEKTARLKHLTSALTGRAGCGRGAGRGPRPLAGMAGMELLQFNGFGYPERCVEERYF